MCRRAGFPGPGFWEPAERLTYFVLLPMMATVGGYSLEALAASAAAHVRVMMEG